MSDSTPPPTKKKIVVLGTGVGSMSAVYGLTHDEDWQRKYSIDVYQLGWRCGGKGAAGRNRAIGDRIEEHGLHMWFGFYQNAFAMIREVYEELHEIAPEYAFKSYKDAFRPRSDLFLQEFVDGHWEQWHMTWPTNQEEPGDGQELDSISTFIREALELLIEYVLGADFLSWLEHHVERFEPDGEGGGSSCLDELEAAVTHGPSRERTKLLTDAHARAQAAGRGDEEAFELVRNALRKILDWLLLVSATEVEHPYATELRRAIIMVDLGLTLLIGLWEDGCFAASSLDPIDEYDWMEWLEGHGALTGTLRSPWVRGLYDGPFAYSRGDSSRPSLSAAVAVRGQLRGLMGYKGAMIWEMRAGMGDTIFTPLYKVLSSRGVDFHFFHKVEALNFNADCTALESVDIGVQIEVKAEHQPYDPLFELNGIECWPSRPFFDKLVDGDALEGPPYIDLESSWANWTNKGDTLTLEAGTDFDYVICGISLAAWPDVAPDLFSGDSAVCRKWQALHTGIPTVMTQTVQLWLDASVSEMGWDQPPAFVGAYAQPFNTFCDLSSLIDMEDWGDEPPKALIYLCGPMRDPRTMEPYGAHWFPATQTARVFDTAADWLSDNAGYPFPKQAPNNEPASLDPGLIRNQTGSPEGWERLQGAYVRANLEPTERYVLSPPGTAKLRMRANESGIDRLVITGDWLHTGLQSGCVEAAVMGGLQASRTICGWPATIIGDDDVW